MTPVNVLVVFYSRYGETERLALAAGLGAIQAEGSIRLRRVTDLAPSERIDADVEWGRCLARMNRDYVAPRPADPAWADVIVLATPAGSSHEVEAYLNTLAELGPMAGKLAAPLTPGPAGACDGVFLAAARAGLIAVPLNRDAHSTAGADLATQARLHGQRLVQLARAMKAPPPVE